MAAPFDSTSELDRIAPNYKKNKDVDLLEIFNEFNEFYNKMMKKFDGHIAKNPHAFNDYRGQFRREFSSICGVYITAVMAQRYDIVGERQTDI